MKIEQPFIIIMLMNVLNILLIIVDKRLKEFTIAVVKKITSCSLFDPRNATTCTSIFGNLGESETQLIFCDEPVKGRYLAIYFSRHEVLSLCEVQVYGKFVSGYKSNISSKQECI